MDGNSSRRKFFKRSLSLLAFGSASILSLKKKAGLRIGGSPLPRAYAGENAATDMNKIDPLDAYRLPSTEELNDREFSVACSGGGSYRVRLTDGQARFSTSGMPWPELGQGPVDVVAIRDGVYFIDIDVEEPAVDGLTIVLLVDIGRALAVHQRREAPGYDNIWTRGPEVKFDWRVGTIDGQAQSGQAPAPTRELIGARDFMLMGPENLYEHIYINSERVFAHHVHTVMVRGKTESQPGAYYKLGDDLYLIGFRELDNAAALVTVVDYKSKRMTGKAHHPISLFESGSRPLGGKVIPVNGRLTYPEGLEPL